MLRGYLCMTDLLKLPNMVSHVLLKVKDGHMTNCPYPSFWPELPNCLDLNSMMDGFTIEIYINFFWKRKRKNAGLEL